MKKKKKIAACADAFPFRGTTFGGWVTSIELTKLKSCRYSHAGNH